VGAQRGPDPGLIVAETAVGAGVAVGAAFAMMRVGEVLVGPRGGEDPGMLGAAIGFSVGLVAGSSLGVHSVARGFGLPARYTEALGGALAGLLLLPMLSLDADEPLAWALGFGVPSLGASLVSSLGAHSRLRIVVQPAGDRVDAGVALAF